MTRHRPTLAEAMKTAELVHERKVLQKAIRRMARAIRKDYVGERPVFLTVMNGGMFFASLLALELEFDVELDYLHATRYRGATEGGGLEWLRRPTIKVRGKRVLLVDDILDEGPTLNEVRAWCQGNGAADVRLAVLAWKRHGRTIPGLLPDYWGVEVPDRYVFGFGMDFHEQGRNLPGIYALP